MSNQDFYNQSGQGQPPYQQQQHPATNPFSSHLQQQQQQPPVQQQHVVGGGGGGGGAQYAPPSGPPPAPRRMGSFKEADFIPEGQRGAQREVLEQYEMNRDQPENETDRDVATLQQQFPGVDGSLIAAIYSDTQSLSATREMLTELADGEANQAAASRR